MTDHVLFEDRTTETPEESRTRRLAGPAAALAATAFQMANGHAPSAVSMLAAALGQAMARTGVPVEEAASLVKPFHDAARAMFEEQLLLFQRHADA